MRSTQAHTSAPAILATVDAAQPRPTSFARLRGVTVGLAAFTIACLGEVMLFNEATRVPGAWLLAGAVLLGVLAWPYSGTLEQATEPASDLTHRREPALRWAGVAIALLLAWAGILAWFADPDAIFGLQGVLWVASMAVLVAACARWRPTGSTTHAGPAWTRLEAAAFCLILALSLLARLAWLGEVPWRFHYDEAIAYTEAMRFYRGPMISVFTTTWWETGLPSMPFALSGGLMHVVGTGIGGSRAAVALLGALTVIPVYGLARLLAGRAAAVLAGLLFAVSAVGIHYSRVSIVNNTTPFFWSVCFYFLLRGLNSRLPADFAWAGLAAGTSMYTYYGTRLLPYLLLAFAFYLAAFHFRLFRQTAGHLLIAAVGFVVGFGPLLAYFFQNPTVWAGRGLAQLTVPPVVPTTWDRLAADWQILSPILWQNFLGLSAIPSQDRVYWAPLMLPVEGALLAIGTGALLWRWRRPSAFLLLLWGAGVLFVGGTLVGSVHVPAFAHWTPAFPVFPLVAALPLALWLQALRRTGMERWLRPGFALVSAGALAIVAANLYTYFITYPPTVPPAFEAGQGRFLSTLAPGTRARFVGKSWQGYYAEIGAMLSPHVQSSDLLNPSRSLPLSPDPGTTQVFIFNTDQAQYLPLIRSYYPGGQVSQINTPAGPVADVYTLPGEYLSRPLPLQPNAGLAVTLTGPGITHRVDPFIGAAVLGGTSDLGRWVKHTDRDPEFKPLAPGGERRIRWEGEVYAEGGEYVMNLRTTANAILRVGGREVLRVCSAPTPEGATVRGGDPGVEAALALAEGWHPVRLDLDASKQIGGLEWTWTRPDGVREIVPPTRLRHGPSPGRSTPAQWPEPPPPVSCAP